MKTLLIILMLCGPVMGAEFTLGEGTVDADDAYGDVFNSDTNFGTAVLTRINDNNSVPGQKFGLVKWEELKDSIVNRTVTAGSLWMEHSGVASDPDVMGVALFGILTYWVEGEVSYDSARSTVLWNTAGAVGSGTDVTVSNFGTKVGLDTTYAGEYLWDVTTLLHTWDGSDTANAQGFLFRPVQGSDNFTGIDYGSADRATASERPRIKVVYTEAAGGATTRRRIELIRSE